MNMPGFSAETSLYKTGGRYRAVASESINYSVVSQLGLPRGLCAKASRLCQDPAADGHWCAILDRCFDGDGGGTGTPQRTCGPCDCNADVWSQKCCLPGGTNCIQKPCTPPEVCTVQNTRKCLPWPLDFICSGSCTRTCCHFSGCDQRLCGVSPC